MAARRASASIGCALAVAACLDKPPPPAGQDATSSIDAVTDAGADAGLDADLSPKTVFVTFDRFSGNMGGVVGADSICQNSAELVGLGGDYKAWLSDALTNPSSRMTHSPGPYVLRNGDTIATSWTDLTDGMLLVPIDRDENGDPSPGGSICDGGEVWTNTTFDGLRLTVDHCSGWNSLMGASSVGDVTQVDVNWTASAICPNVSCGSLLPLYCFEQ